MKDAFNLTDGPFRRVTPEEWKRLGTHAFALASVAAATLAKSVVGATTPAATFLFFNAAVAVSATRGGIAAGAVATLASVAVARIASGAPWSACLFFAAEGLLVAYLVIRLSAALRQHRDWLDSAEETLRQLRAVERHGRVIDAAFSQLQDASHNRAVVILNRDGQIAEWRTGATRLYGVGAERIVGVSGAALFSPELSAEQFAGLLSDARRGVIPRLTGTHRRADGREFEAEVEIRWLTHVASDGFTVMIHDLSGRHASEAFARLAQETQVALREEADVAQQQLASLQSVTDPYLNALTGADAISSLLDRLRTAVGADGIALVQIGGFRPRLFWAGEGLQPQPASTQSHAGTAGERLGRTVLIHNDAARVGEMSAARWPPDVLSLISVPVLRGGETHAVIEVAYLRGRRSTEWEIALIQVAAARAAGLLKDESYAKTGAVA